VQVGEIGPPLFEVGERVDLAVLGRVLDVVQSVEEVVVDLPIQVPVPVQRLAESVGRVEPVSVVQHGLLV